LIRLPLAPLVFCGLAAASLSCTTAKGHRILELFFDGVPPLTAPAAAPRPGGPSASAAPDFRVREHGPYAAKLCDACHETGRSNALVVPAEQLCVRCHTLDLRKRYIHGPLLAGGCLLCHDPHESRYPYLLVSDSSTFCVRCHDRSALRAVEGHGEGAPSCTTCHEAHGSDRRFLLK